MANYINLILAVVVLWLLFLTFAFVKIKKFYSLVFKNKKPQSLDQLIKDIIENLKEDKIEIQKIKKDLKSLNSSSQSLIKYVSFKRYNPLKEFTEGKSFVLVFLDQKYNGVILNFIYSKNNYLIFPKTIINKQGKDVELTKEEKEAISLALKNKL